MLKKTLFFILFCFVFKGCGLPDASSFQEFQFPALIVGTYLDKPYPYCKVTDSGGVEIELLIQGYNPESTFSGYNIYVTQQTASVDDIKTNLISQASLHVISGSSASSFDTSIQDNFIILKNRNQLPSIKSSELTAGYSNSLVLSTFTVKNLPYEVDNGGSFTPSTQYGFGVTAVSIPMVKESQLSNVIIIETPQEGEGPCILSQETRMAH